VAPAPTLEALARRFGVTRLARVTGLDRCGVEVVAAVRPRGHVLQVSQGKGRTLEQARWSALGEAVELAAAEDPHAARLRYAAGPLGGWDPGQARVAWLEGEDLATGRPAPVPAQEILCPPLGSAWLGPVSTGWSSNGLGFHPVQRQRAVEHAVLELHERHAVARALPRGWTEESARRRLVAPSPLAAALGRRGFAALAFDLSVGRLPVAGALLFDLEEGPVPLTAGYACRRSFAAAVEAALLEAAQSRLTEIHGAREDVLLGEREAGRPLLRRLTGARPRGTPPPAWRGSLARGVGAPVTVVTLSAAPWVVKAASPALLRTELL
jgi:ribosomal protein S12 methylthiotransferase accessory factor